jgi:peptide/nickel transport system substrate-binding protein
VDDYTIKANLTIWQNRMIRSFAGATTYMVSPTAYQKNGVDWMRWHMVGTGAYVQDDFQRDVSTTGSRNPSYWEPGKPYLDKFQMLYIADELTRLMQFKNGGGEILDCGDNARIASELQTAGNKIITKSQGVIILVPDSANADSPWSNLKVRQAAEYAIDKEAMAKTFGYGFTQAAYQVPYPGSPAFKSDLSGMRKYDAAKAKQLLTEAGYPSGFKTAIIAPSNINKDLAVALQANLADIGIQCELQSQDAAAYAKTVNGTWKNALVYHSLIETTNLNHTLNMYFGTPSAWFQSMKKPDNWTSLLNASLISASPEPALMQKCAQALADDTTVIPVNSTTAMWAVSKNLQDSGLSERGDPIYFNPQNAWLSK